MEHLGLMFGALAACPNSEIRGYGAPLRSMTFALLAIPAVWDWYLQWREGRRGFFTRWESEMLTVAAALTRCETGWLRQSPKLAGCLRPIEGLVTPKVKPRTTTGTRCARSLTATPWSAPRRSTASPASTATHSSRSFPSSKRKARLVNIERSPKRCGYVGRIGVVSLSPPLSRRAAF